MPSVSPVFTEYFSISCLLTDIIAVLYPGKTSRQLVKQCPKKRSRFSDELSYTNSCIRQLTAPASIRSAAIRCTVDVVLGSLNEAESVIIPVYRHVATSASTNSL